MKADKLNQILKNEKKFNNSVRFTILKLRS